jgi:heptosyltransferase-2
VKSNPASPQPVGREIAWDCRWFRGDRPCTWHKQTGVLCTCDHYDPVIERVLIIKLDAMGDVLRSTALLPAIAETHPHAAITWVTRTESAPLLRRNRYIAEVLELGAEALVHLQAREFDHVINLDAGATSAALASLAKSSRKDGFVLDPRGYVQPTNEAARRWLECGLFDDLKRSGRSTYQSRMADILGVAPGVHRYVFELGDDEIAEGRAHLDALGIDVSRPVVGLNTGAGGRWPLKQWREAGYVELLERFGDRTDVQFVLLGGPAERERHRRLKATVAAPLFDSGCDNPVRHFAALVRHCDVVVTGDTLAMHLAIALERRLVVLFGPTSAAEIELYGLGDKLTPRMDCLSCYKTACSLVPNCMDLISTDMVAAALERQLTIARSADEPSYLVPAAASARALD